MNRYDIGAGQFFFSSANQIMTVEYMSDDATGYYCHFQSDIFLQSVIKTDIEKDFSFLQISGGPLFQIANSDRFIQLLDILESECHLSQSERFDLVPLYLLALFSEIKHLADASQKQSIDAASYLTQRYKNALSELIYDKKTVVEFADYLAVTPNHLNKSVKTTTGKSAHELLEDMRILEAKVLLRQTNLSIAKIAFKIGRFESSDFSRFFKKSVGQTPVRYRNG